MWEQLEKTFKHLRGVNIPSAGWVKTIRKALGMNSEQLAKRCKVSRQRINEIERDEIAKKTTIETIEKVAQQLECDFVYALVPKSKISNIVEKQARRKAIQQMESSPHTMSRERQETKTKSNKKQLKLLIKDLMRFNLSSIWK